MHRFVALLLAMALSIGTITVLAEDISPEAAPAAIMDDAEGTSVDSTVETNVEPDTTAEENADPATDTSAEPDVEVGINGISEFSAELSNASTKQALAAEFNFVGLTWNPNDQSERAIATIKLPTDGTIIWGVKDESNTLENGDDWLIYVPEQHCKANQTVELKWNGIYPNGAYPSGKTNFELLLWYNLDNGDAEVISELFSVDYSADVKTNSHYLVTIEETNLGYNAQLKLDKGKPLTDNAGYVYYVWMFKDANDRAYNSFGIVPMEGSDETTSVYIGKMGGNGVKVTGIEIYVVTNTDLYGELFVEDADHLGYGYKGM